MTPPCLYVKGYKVLAGCFVCTSLSGLEGVGTGFVVVCLNPTDRESTSTSLYTLHPGL